MTNSINNYNTKQSSCYFLDIRNSTNIIRTISLDRNSTLTNTETRINAHAEFMRDIHSFLVQKLEDLGITDYYFSNTGDGHTCLLWNKTHAWTILHISCAMADYLDKRIEQYKLNYLDNWSKEYEKKEISTGFGIGMHTGGSIINHQMIGNNNFAYGVVLNSAARTEAFTKNFPNISLLFTGNLKAFLKKQFPYLSSPKRGQWSDYEQLINPVTYFPVDIKDGKPAGHQLFTITKNNRSWFLTS